MKPTDMWDRILDKAKASDYDLHTTPMTKREPLWFHVGVDKHSIIISTSLHNRPSSKLAFPRRITYKEFELVFGYYDQWKNRIPGIRRTVADLSQNTAYILALIADIQP